MSSKISDSEWTYPLSPCYRSGKLQVDTQPDHILSWEEYGHPGGEPVMVLHGGPGGACDPILSRFFNPNRYRVILFDQRSCGKSTPTVYSHGPEVALTNNTTAHLVEDIAKLRKELNSKGKMHVFGGSWGSTLALAYAIKHPETVQTLILRGIFIGSAADLHYMYQGNAATYAHNPYGLTAPGAYITFPEAWKQFVEIIPPEKRGDMMKAYKEIFDMKPASDGEKESQMRAAVAWSVWEGTISNLIPDINSLGKFQKDDFAVCFAQIEAHYFAHDLFLPNNYFVDNAPILAKIPTHIVHGRYDQVCPLTQADTLAAAYKKHGATPASFIKTTAGHSMLDRETCLALISIMDNLPPMAPRT